ncbi:succinyl-CoA synthetase alpha subunit [Geosmithia morbida]|uniref:Succinyl-CoA synthetase alpha subunit n=1 Tax=Geosmithia morbida TaxID=1094350 RepID=A0A9P5D5V5_9HYPO|nr:succinyl-CoA synthetase alpha subunit [Geosmithia morbida]KAF4122884.1 succinyl-CoA synthetase alpha subunit [Geosmithia morbida]
MGDALPIIGGRFGPSLSPMRSMAFTSNNKTIQSLNIDKISRVIYQGFTSKAPMDSMNPDVSSVFVPAHSAARAITESIEAELPLVVSVSEHIPVHDMLRDQEILRSQCKTRLVSPTCPGKVAPWQCQVGIMPYKQYSPGCVGIVSKSGTLSYEAVGATTKTVDPELEAYHRDGCWEDCTNGRTMGHAGAILSPQDVPAEVKAKALKDAGSIMVNHPGREGIFIREEPK